MSKKKIRKPGKQKPKDASSVWKTWLMSKDAGEPPSSAPKQIHDLKSWLHGGFDGPKRILDEWKNTTEVLLEQKATLGPALAETAANLYQKSCETLSRNATAAETDADAETYDMINLYGRILEKLAAVGCKPAAKAARKEIHRLKSLKLGRNLSPARASAGSGKDSQNAYERSLKELENELATKYPCVLSRYSGAGSVFLHLPSDEQSGDAMDFLIIQTGCNGIKEVHSMALPETNRKKFYQSIEAGDPVKEYGTIPLDLGIRILRRAMEQTRASGLEVPALCNMFLEIHADRSPGLRHPAKELFPETDGPKPHETDDMLSHWGLELLDPPIQYDDLDTIMETGSTSGILLTGLAFLENRKEILSKKINNAFDSNTRNYYAEILMDTAVLAALHRNEPGFVEWCVRLADFVKNSPLENSAFLETMVTRAIATWEQKKDRQAIDSDEHDQWMNPLASSESIDPKGPPRPPETPDGLIIPWK